MNYIIATDTSANLPFELLRERNIELIPFSMAEKDGVMHSVQPESFDGKAFFDGMRRGRQYSTSQINPQSYEEFFGKFASKGLDVLYVSMSSGISGSYNSACMAIRRLEEDYPERSFVAIDTLGASLGEGLAALKAAELRDEGVGIERAAEMLREYVQNTCNIFTVDDLAFLRRTGRLSNAAAVVGMVLNVKPILIGDKQGKIVCSAKVRGRKRALRALADRYARLATEPEKRTVGIAHADCAEDAAILAELIREIKEPKEILTVMYEPVTGSHVGPGTLALFFEGKGGRE